MQETGYTRPALMMLLVRTRRAFGVTRDVKDAQSGRRNARRRIPAKHDEFHAGFSVQPAPWSSRGRRYNPAFDEKQLQDFFLGPAMQRYQIAIAFWLHGRTSGEIAETFGIKKKAVEFQLARIRRMLRNPLQPIKVMRAVTQDGKQRNGVSAPYIHRASVVQDPASRVIVEP